MSLYADSNYSFNPWMRDILPQMRPDIVGIEMLEQEELIEAISAQVPPPPDAGLVPRFGYEQRQATIQDVFAIGFPSLMNDTPTRQDSGMQGSPRNSLGVA